MFTNPDSHRLRNRGHGFQRDGNAVDENDGSKEVIDP